MEIKNCRVCDTILPSPFLDLGSMALANNYETKDTFSKDFPLAVSFCSKCYMVQLTHNIDPKHLFSNYSYFSSYSSTFLEHAKEMVRDFHSRDLLQTPDVRVLEIGSNDGYLLKYIKDYTPHILGVEPATNIAEKANADGIPTMNVFFNLETAKEIAAVNSTSFHTLYDLIIGNNVLAHVPDINDFLEGVYLCLSPSGTAVFEVPYLTMLLERTEFDTIYHEHVFYYSVIALKNLFKLHKLEIIDVRFSPIHGGSIQVFVSRIIRNFPKNSSVSNFEFNEHEKGLNNSFVYENFSNKVSQLSSDLRQMLQKFKQKGYSIAAYGAPAKGNTLLNYAGLGINEIAFTVDISPHKQGLFLPGSHIPIFHPDKLIDLQPDYCLILPWNFKEEIMEQQHEYLEKGGKFIVPIPIPHVVEI